MQSASQRIASRRFARTVPHASVVHPPPSSPSSAQSRVAAALAAAKAKPQKQDPLELEHSASVAVSDTHRNLETIKLLFDGECPLCLREVAVLRGRAEAFDTPTVSFVDIAAPDYRPEENGGVSFQQAMGRIHAVLPGGTVVSGIEVFRNVYEALGMGWVYSWTNLPVFGKLAGVAYDFWADRRLQWTGRPALDEIVKMRQKADDLDDRSCNIDGCSVEGRIPEDGEK